MAEEKKRERGQEMNISPSTTIEQSVELLRLGVPPHTSDMFFQYRPGVWKHLNEAVLSYPDLVNKQTSSICAWSATRLLNMMPLVRDINYNCQDVAFSVTVTRNGNLWTCCYSNQFEEILDGSCFNRTLLIDAIFDCFKFIYQRNPDLFDFSEFFLE